MSTPFENLQKQRKERKEKEQRKRDDQSDDKQVRRDKRLLLTMNYSPMVVEILEQLRNSIYPGLSIGEDSWECKWYLYRPVNQSHDKEIILSVTLKLDRDLEPQCFQCERNTGKFDFHGGPRYFRETKSLDRKELIKILKKLHPSVTV
jgi:hypothetical protein